MLFEMLRDPECENPQLGYETLEVLAIVPFALAEPDKEDVGCWKVVRNTYVCNTEKGLVRLDEEELWAAVERGEYLVPSQAPDDGEPEA